MEARFSWHIKASNDITLIGRRRLIGQKMHLSSAHFKNKSLTQAFKGVLGTDQLPNRVKNHAEWIISISLWHCCKGTWFIAAKRLYDVWASLFERCISHLLFFMCQDGRCAVLLFAYLILCASDLCIGHKMCLPKSLNTYHGNGCRGAKVCVLRSQWRNSKSF